MFDRIVERMRQFINATQFWKIVLPFLSLNNKINLQLCISIFGVTCSHVTK
jgi:hypothetical protein